MEIKVPITSTTTKVTSGAAILLAILAIVLSGGLTGQDNVYACLDTKMAMQCDKLSKTNADGLQTRCYYTEKIETELEVVEKTRYKNCKTGWLPYTPEKEILEINFTEKTHVYLLCERNNELVSLCQVVDVNETIYKVDA